MSAYDIGDRVRVTTTFTLSDVNTNTTVAVAVRAPDGTETSPSATNSATGVYYIDLDLTQAGDWMYRFTGTGTVKAVSAGRIAVAPNDW